MSDQNNLTLRMLLENPELLEVPSIDESESSYKEKDFMNESSGYDVQSAFLGPTIWQNTIPSEYLDLPTDMLDQMDVSAWLNEQTRMKEMNGTTSHENVSLDAIDLDACLSPLQEDQPQIVYQQPLQHFEMDFQDNNKECPPPTQEKSNNLPSQKESFSGTKFNLPLRAIVGDELFDPSKRAFSSDELKVAPILPKSQKNFVPSEKKDDHYWTRRIKNNTAAKRSREAKRMKENQITLRTAYLEDENANLKEELAKAIEERNELKCRLRKYEYVID